MKKVIVIGLVLVLVYSIVQIIINASDSEVDGQEVDEHGFPINDAPYKEIKSSGTSGAKRAVSGRG